MERCTAFVTKFWRALESGYSKVKDFPEDFHAFSRNKARQIRRCTFPPVTSALAEKLNGGRRKESQRTPSPPQHSAVVLVSRGESKRQTTLLREKTAPIEKLQHCEQFTMETNDNNAEANEPSTNWEEEDECRVCRGPAEEG